MFASFSSSSESSEDGKPSYSSSFFSSATGGADNCNRPERSQEYIIENKYTLRRWFFVKTESGSTRLRMVNMLRAEEPSGSFTSLCDVGVVLSFCGGEGCDGDIKTLNIEPWGTVDSSWMKFLNSARFMICDIARSARWQFQKIGKYTSQKSWK